MATAVLFQALMGHTSPGPLLTGLVGYHGLALLGAAMLGGFGPVLSALFALAVAVVGVNGANEPAWWAWPLEPDVSTQAAAAAAIWLVGLAAYLLGQRRSATWSRA
ncbi:hypothetical protein [Intrasporangium mesophilum]